MTRIIASRQNPWFKRIREALRDHAGEVVLEGPKAVADAISAGWNPIAIVTRVNEGGGSTDDPSLDPVPPAGVMNLGFAPDIYDALAATRAPQGVIGLFHRPEASLAGLFARSDAVIVALDGVQDPGNVGTIIRLAAAFDAAGVALLPGCADAFSPKSIRASAGAILSVPTAETTHDDLARAAAEHGYSLFVADGAGPAGEPPSARAVIVFGNEGSGATPAMRNLAQPLSVASSERVESLNVAAAAAILLWRSYILRS